MSLRDVQFLKTNEFPRFHVVPHDFAPGPDVVKRTEEIWAAEKARRGDGLFNGQFFSVLDLETGAGFFTDYRFWLAQRRDPALKEALNLLPLAVTGVTCCDDGILFGLRRGDGEDLWEPIPAGGVDDGALEAGGQVDLERQILAELKEETGIDVVKAVLPRGIAIDRSMPLVDAVMELEVEGDSEAVQRRFERSGSIEHNLVRVVPDREIGCFLRENQGNLVATALPVMQGLGYV